MPGKLNAVLLAAALLPWYPAPAVQSSVPEGWLLWHSYTQYTDMDSRLYLRDPDGTVTQISGDFENAMNGSFGSSPDSIVFMAIDREADEWDIFLYDAGNSRTVNLTKNSGFRNEDVRFSPDGEQIVFKRGYWSQEADGFVYNLALLDVRTLAVTMLTDDLSEEAMPCFSSDGNFIYFADYREGCGAICRMELQTGKRETICAAENVTSYYPVCSENALYFTSWYSPDNHHDRIMQYDGGQIMPMPFNSELYDCSDPCPAADGCMIYSSTINGSYDLYWFDGTGSFPIADLNTEKNELGASFFPLTEVHEPVSRIPGDVSANGELDLMDAVLLQKWLLGSSDAVLPDWRTADCSGDGKLSVNDLVLIRRMLIYDDGISDAGNVRGEGLTN